MAVDPDFEELVKLYYRDLYRFGFGLTLSEADACDLTQQTFYIWATKGHQLKDLASVKGWLFTTLHREFLQTCRRKERFSDEPMSEAAPNLPQVCADIVNRIDAETMLEVLGQIERRLPGTTRAVLHGRSVSQRDRRRVRDSARHRAVANRARQNASVAQAHPKRSNDPAKLNEYQGS
jgi:DNA-directed RNA polymerase specialized sigma24 family protein